MSFVHFSNFLLVPGSGQGQADMVYELEESSHFEKNSFVIVPYANPQVDQFQPEFFKIISSASLADTSPATQKTGTPIKLSAKTSRSQYIHNVKQLREHIQQGNIYEVNYCIQFYAQNVIIEPVSIFYKLHALSQAPYSYLLKMADNYVICASPELFLKKEGQLVSTKPIKGTIKRGKTAEEDERLKKELFNDLKERTENVMAVDVARNDLSILATKGSVKVNKLYNIESFETVHQMVSTVSCGLKDGIDFKGILKATFPMASMTGAPKKRAMTLIDEFENFKRGTYSGAMGLIDEHENFDLSVNIRSIFYNSQKKEVTIAVGSAITYLSDPEKEYEECLLKAKALLKALNAEIEN